MMMRWILCLLMILFIAVDASAETAKDQFYRAEAAYKKLKNNPQKQKYRDNWLACIEKFKAVHRHDPPGPWAAAGLYRAGFLYRELYKHSYKNSDQKAALALFGKIVDEYPKSRYQQKARKSIRAITGKAYQKKAPSSVSPDEAKAKKKYLIARDFYQALKRNPTRQKYRHNWLAGIEKYQAVYDQDPGGPWAAAGLYQVATLYRELYEKSYMSSDNERAIEIFEKIIVDYPISRYRKKSAESLKIVSKDSIDKELDDIIRDTVKKYGAKAEKQKGTDKKKVTTQTDPTEAAKATPAKMTMVTSLRYWSNPSYTRIVIDADQDTSYIHRLLKKDPAIKKPQRLFVDLSNSRLGKDLKKLIPIDDNLLIDARAGQYTVDTVRVVVDIKSFKTYKIFSLNNPFRIVIDMWGKEIEKDKPIITKPEIKITKKDKELAGNALTKQLALGVKRIVIDAGHGGRDYGAPGYYKTVHEKEVVLKLAKRLATIIQKELKIEAVLTRSGDQFITLEERTAMANTKNGDLFISLHTNAHKDKRAYGIETYFLNLATDEESIRVAAMENATSKKNISDLETILMDLMQNSKINESSRLAYYIQNAICRHLVKKGYGHIRNKGVKQAPFYVLLGAQMPSVLIETSFISNARECKRLKNDRYQQRLCEGIVAGIRQYIKETKPLTSFQGTGSDDREG